MPQLDISLNQSVYVFFRNHPDKTTAWNEYLDAASDRGLHKRRLEYLDKWAESGSLSYKPGAVRLGDLAIFDALLKGLHFRVLRYSNPPFS